MTNVWISLAEKPKTDERRCFESSKLTKVTFERSFCHDDREGPRLCSLGFLRKKMARMFHAKVGLLAQLFTAILWITLERAWGQQVVNGTFTDVRNGNNGDCVAVTASIVEASFVITDSAEQCMRMQVSDILTNMAPMIRYVDAGVANTTEIEVAIGALVVNGSLPSAISNLSYSCPPNGYNGFFREFGSFCEMTENTQLWATFVDYETKLLHQIRVILSYEFPEESTLTDNEPPFGTVLLNFPQGLDLLSAGIDDELIICEVDVIDETDEQVMECPVLPAVSNLNVKLTATSFGYFGAQALGTTQIPSNWYQDDEKQLLSGITTPSTTNGLQDFYFNGSGFFLHSYMSPDGSADTCSWFPFCDYECEVYNYDARFFDDLGTFNVTWKLNQEQFDTADYSKNSTLQIRAYMGNAIDAAGIFPCLIYTNTDQNAYHGLDKIGSADATKQPDYSYFWYSRYELGPPDIELLTPPLVCFVEANNASASTTTSEPMSTPSPSTTTTNRPIAAPVQSPSTSDAPTIVNLYVSAFLSSMWMIVIVINA